MNKLTFSLILFIVCNYIQAQSTSVPGVQWQKCFGGSSIDYISPDSSNVTQSKSLVKTFDGGYVVGGITYSNDGNVSGNHGSGDIWIAKLDSSRNILWSKTLGGTGVEDFGSIRQTSDGGFIFIGSTRSNNGDVSGHHNINTFDVWVVRLSASGDIIWQKCLGGTRGDEGAYIHQTTDGSFILSASTFSNDGDISGNHNINTTDIWIVKLNSLGAIIWQKCFGGTSDDLNVIVKPTLDGNYIIAANVQSLDGDISANHGGNDIWIAKINSIGNIIWKNCYGGTQYDVFSDIQENNNGSYVISGQTFSNDGDVSGNHSGFWSDGWVFSINNTGVLLWQKCYGGTRTDFLNSVEVTSNGDYVLCGLTASSDGDVSGIHAGADIWVIRISSTGGLIWQKCLGGSNEEESSNLQLTNDDGVVIFGNTTSNNGDVSGNNGSFDFWLVKIGNTNILKGTVFKDNNSNGIKDANEIFVNGILMESYKTGYARSSVTVNGIYFNEVDTGTYTTSLVTNIPYYNLVPVSTTKTFTTYFNTDSSSYALQPIAGKRDLEIYLISITPARPGFASQYKIIYKNVGTDTLLSGNVDFIRDYRQTNVLSTPLFTYQNADTFRITINNLKPFDSASIYVNVQNPVSLTLNDTLHLRAIISSAGDLTPINNTASLVQRVVGSYDPNDKNEVHGGSVTLLQVASSEYLNYIIRFQNTGTDTAFNISIKDTLDNNLDWNTIQMISSSHPYSVSITNDNQVLWYFNNILLPDSNKNETASHGYIAYKVRLKTTLNAGDTVKNNASIYFDFNAPVPTNTNKSIVDQSIALPVNFVDLQGYFKDGTIKTLWQTLSEYNSHSFEVERSAEGIYFTKIGVVRASGNTSGSSYRFEDTNPLDGVNYYRLKIIDNDGKFYYSKIVAITALVKSISLQLFPNPAKNILYLKTKGINKESILQVTDAKGAVVQKSTLLLNDNSTFALDIKNLSPGIYHLTIFSSRGIRDLKFMKK